MFYDNVAAAATECEEEAGWCVDISGDLLSCGHWLVVRITYCVTEEPGAGS